MNPSVLDYIRTLSLADKKTLSQKALKAGEEFGELARVVLPFDNAYATTHRFVEQDKILEEVADLTLCAWSVAYDLGYSHDDIEVKILEKAKKWHNLQLGEGEATWPLPFEIHITVNTEYLLSFKETCVKLKVKPILLELDVMDEKQHDLQTSSVFIGTNRGAYEECKRISAGLAKAGFLILREKIETVPWHPAAPRAKRKLPLDLDALEKESYQDLSYTVVMPKDCYFEAHFTIIIDRKDIPLLRNWCGAFPLHVSQNIFKKVDNKGTVKIMATLRDSNTTYEGFLLRKVEVDRYLKSAGYVVENTVVEFSVYDTKLSHDTAWIAKSFGVV